MLSADCLNLLKNRLISYLLDKDLICAEQLGFMQGRSTGLQLLNVLTEAWDSKTTEELLIGFQDIASGTAKLSVHLSI